jgi:type I restriction enzyme M protein
MGHDATQPEENPLIALRDQLTRNRLLSRLELTEFMGVHRATITTWSKRFPDFPRPVEASGAEYYWLDEIALWSDSRPIPEAERSPNDPPGDTYGRRLRRQAAGSAAIRPGGDPADERRQQRSLGELLDRRDIVARWVAGQLKSYLALLMCLIFMRRSSYGEWSKLRRYLDAGRARPAPESLVRDIGNLADQALRKHGVVPGARPAIGRLRPRKAADLDHVIHQCDDLGSYAFNRLLGQFSIESRLGAADSFTSDEAGFLMAQLVARDTAPGRPVYDPYLRGGELLRAVFKVLPSSDQIALYGESADSGIQPFAGMSIVVAGDGPTEIRRLHAAPWNDPERRTTVAGAVLLNPPFNKAVDTDLPNGDWPFGDPPADKSDFAWLQYAVTCLAPRARAAVLMPRHAGASANRSQGRICREMVERGSVEAIIMLPPRLFPSSTAKVNLWIVGPPTGTPGRVLFIDATRMVNRSKTEQVLAIGATDEIVALYRQRYELADGEQRRLPSGGRAVMAALTDIRGAEHSLNPTNYLEHEADANFETRPGYGAPGVSSLVTKNALTGQIAEARHRDAALDRFLAAAGPTDTAADRMRVPLSDISEIRTGPRSEEISLKKRAETGTVPIVMPKHLRDRRISKAEMDKVSEGTAISLDRFHLIPGDILCVRAGAITEPAIAEQEQTGWLYGTNLIRIRAHPDEVDANYLLGYLCLPATQEWIRQQSGATSASSIKTESLKHLLVPLPPIDEQRKIGRVFRAFDDQIIACRKVVEHSIQTRAEMGAALVEGGLIIS